MNMDVLNSNDYNRGFADGQKDAEAQKDPNYIRMGHSLKFAIHGSSALDSYTRGYNDGYREAMRKSIVQKVEVVNTPNDKGSPNSGSIKDNRVINHQTSSGSMSNIQSFELQIEALQKMEQLLRGTIEDLLSRMKLYDDQVHALLEEGLPIEFLNQYDENYLEVNSQNLRSLTEEMEESDIKYIHDTIAKLEEMDI